MYFTLKIELGNAAMMTPDDIAGVLRELAAKLKGNTIDAGELDPFDRKGGIRDENGNQCGEWIIK